MTIPSWAPPDVVEEGPTTRPAPEYGSDHIVQLLHELGIEHVAFNPGATFRGLHDSLVNFDTPRPGVVLCLHEEIAVAVAHGYAKATGTPMAVALHDVVGLQHAAMAVYNAWCDRVPMLLIGATGPLDAAQRRPWIDWSHTANTQATQIRDYTKWDDQPMSLAAVPESLVRAVHLTRTRPSGPVYVNIDSVIQEQEVPEEFSPPDVRAYSVPTPVAPDRAAIATLAEWTLDAHRPVIFADYVGRDPEAFALLVELAELLDIPVVDREGPYNKLSLNFPTQHRLNGASFEDDLLADADLVIGLETRDLFGVLNATRPGRRTTPRVGPHAKVVLVTLAHLVTGAWTGDFQRLHPTDLLVTGDSRSVLEELLSHLRRVPAAPAPADGRRCWAEWLGAGAKTRREGWRRTAEAAAGETPIAWAHLARTLDEVTASDDRVLANGHLGNWIHRLWDLHDTASYHGDAGGAGLGYGLGASIGIALAHRGSDRLVVDVQSDGDALYTPSALWTAAHEEVPLLIVMDNNQAYNNSMEHAVRMARARGRSEGNKHVGTELADPSIDFATMARAYGMHAEGPVTDPAHVRPALERAAEVVRSERRPALVDIVTARSWWTHVGP